MIIAAMGVVLILSALLLFIYNRYEEYRAGKDSGRLLHDIHKIIAKNREDFSEENGKGFTGSSRQNAKEDQPRTDKEAITELQAVTIDGYGYIGYLSVPDLDLELPVMEEWDEKRLKIAPCRHSGSSVTDDLVIAAHNYKTHFGPVSKLNIGALITFTDMEGNRNQYVLEKLETLPPDAVEAVLDSEYDLVLYTCTPGGAARVAAFCERVADGNSLSVYE